MSSHKSRAFTIVELLVAVGVTALLVTFMVTVTTNVLSAWNRSSGVLSAGNQARTILDQIGKDLESALIRRGSDVMMAATIQHQSAVVFGSWAGNTKPNSSESLVVEPAELPFTDYRFGRAGVWFRFFTTPSDNSPDPDGTIPLTRLSAPRAVAYQMARVDSGGGQFSYLLYRSEVDPQQVFALGYDLSTNYTSGIIRTPTRQWIIGNDVVDFGVRLYKRSASGNLELLFPTRGNLLVTDFQASESSGYPNLAEVFIRILSPEGVRLISALESPGSTLTSDWWDIVEQHSQVYTRRIEIKSKSL